MSEEKWKKAAEEAQRDFKDLSDDYIRLYRQMERLIISVSTLNAETKPYAFDMNHLSFKPVTRFGPGGDFLARRRKRSPKK